MLKREDVPHTFDFEALKRVESERDALQARVAELEEQYGELIFAVATKYPDETRHQTALRYIQQAENREASPACELKP